MGGQRMYSTENVNAKFWKFALPSMLGQLLNSLFIIVDGFFIGQNLGDNGLAAINVAWPIVALIQAVSMAIGTGSAVQMAIYIGKGDMEATMKTRAHGILLLVLATIFIGFLFYFTYPVVLPLLGANETIYQMTADYIRVICITAACQVFIIGVMPLLRSAGRAMTAMFLTILGLIGNIFMDWLFIQVFQWGIRGAATATACSQGICAFIGLFFLIFRKGWPLHLRHFKLEGIRVARIFHYGLSPFGLTISISILILMNNLQAIRYGGTRAVAVYAVLSYTLGSVLPLVSGVGEGIQPLFGNAYGARDFKAIHHLRRNGYLLAVGTACFCSVLCFFLKNQIPLLFGTSPEAAAEGAGAMWTLVLGFPFMAVVRFTCSYFCALAMPLESSILAYGEPLLAQPLFLFLLPLFLKLNGVWIAYPVAVILMAGIAAMLTFRHRKQLHLDEAYYL